MQKYVTERFERWALYYIICVDLGLIWKNIFNIQFLQLKLPQNLKYLSHSSCLKNLFKTSDCLLLWMEGLCYLLMDDFYFSVYKSGWQRNLSGKTWWSDFCPATKCVYSDCIIMVINSRSDWYHHSASVLIE